MGEIGVRKPTKKQTLTQMVKFTLFSISAGGVQILSFTMLNEFARFPYRPAYLIALILSVLYNFTVNRAYTFKSAGNVPLAMMKVTGYYLVFTPASTWWGGALTNIGWNEYIVLFGTMIINFVTEFLFYRLIVYRKSMYTNKLGKKEIAKLEKEMAGAESASRWKTM